MNLTDKIALIFTLIILSIISIILLFFGIKGIVTAIVIWIATFLALKYIKLE